MKGQPKNVFTSLSLEKRSREKPVKLEKKDSFYAEDFSKREHNENVLYGKLAVKNTLQNSNNSYQKRNVKPSRNPLNSNRKFSR